jgi:hypothetical protein
VLLLLVAAPFTEPFSVCTPASLAGAARAQQPALPYGPAIGHPGRPDAGYPPLSLTDDQLHDAKAAIAAPLAATNAAVGLVSAVYVTSADSPVDALYAPLILRI